MIDGKKRTIYLLASLTVFISLLTAARKLLVGRDSDTPVLLALRNVLITSNVPIAGGQHQQPIQRPTVISEGHGSGSSSGDYEPNTHHEVVDNMVSLTEDDKSSYSSVQLQDLVELYGEGSAFAAPALVLSMKKDALSANFRYDVQDLITKRRYTGVAPDFIHKYQVYDDGTDAVCNIGVFRKVEMMPCEVISHVKKLNGFVEYEIWYLNDEEEVVKKHLSFDKVQRRM